MFGTALTRPSLTTQLMSSVDGGAENAGQDIAGQDNDGQEKHHA